MDLCSQSTASAFSSAASRIVVPVERFWVEVPKKAHYQVTLLAEQEGTLASRARNSRITFMR